MKIQVLTLMITFLTLEAITGQSIDQNYVKSTDYKEGFTTTTVSNATSEQKIESIQYFDGLGRPIQSIGISAGGSSEDIITHIGYDSYGRIEKDYLPVSVSLNGLSYNNFVDEDYINTFYDAKYTSEWPGSIEENAYSQKLFEDSPLNRVLKQAAPGEDWKLSNDHVIEFDYDANDSNDVKLYTVSLTSDYTPSLIGGTSYYAVNTLYKNITYDENHTSGTAHSTQEYKDKQGKVILKRTYGDSDENMDGVISGANEINAAHDTYYIYDDYGNLTYVLAPKMDATSTALDTIISQLDQLGYQYKYDRLNRLVKKKIPGKDEEFIIYDKLDRPVLTQDAFLRADDKWLFTKYDVFGRVAYTGIYTHGTTLSRSAMQTHLNTNRDADASHYEEKTSSGDYYTNSDFPKNDCEILTFNYYDNYTFNRAGAGATATSFGVSSNTNVMGLPTGSRTKVLDQSPAKWITNVTYYDGHLRPIYIYTDNNYLETIDIVEIKLIEDSKPNDIRGLTHETKTTHQKLYQSKHIVTTDKFTYDHMGRLVTQKQQINAQPEELMVLNEYDELGQLKNKKVGGDVATILENSVGLQTVDYTYNIRGWLNGINNIGGSNSSITLGSGDLFGFQINYNNPTDTSKELFNGNISQTLWKTTSVNPDPPNNPVSTNYMYSYDALNRITSAIENTTNYNLSNVSYDKNGNITKLKRNGHRNTTYTSFGIMDDLSYSYQSNSNKLMKVADAASIDQFGFKDDVPNTAADSTDDYLYDDNGNLTLDTNKGITSISYNHLNLPTIIKFGVSDRIEYFYDATGVKQKKKVTDNSNITTIDYAGNYVYESGYLQFFNTPEGYVTPNDETDYDDEFSYVYQYKDHLGNIRLSYTDLNQNIGSVNLEIVEENNYYPFGLQHKGYNNVVNGTEHPYTYNGKEEQNELGLNWIDYGARNYDASLGRWMNLDPLAEIYHTDTPYAYVLNNPLSFIDPDGRQVIGVTKDDAKKTHDDLNTVFAGKQFDALRGLFSRGKKNNKKKFDAIDGGALKSALSGLSGDDLALAELVTGAINSKAKFKVEFAERTDNLSTDGTAALNAFSSKLYTDNGHKAPTNLPTTRTGKDFEGFGGSGFNAPTTDGSHSFILEGTGASYPLGRRELTTLHEIFGHGVPSAKKTSHKVNSENAVRTENLVRRVLGIKQQRDGTNHGAKVKIQNPSALPIKN